MSQQKFQSFFFPGGVELKVMNDVVFALESKGHIIFIDERCQYGAFGDELPRCAVHQVLRRDCGCPRAFTKVGLIHDFTWAFFHPNEPVGRDEVIHHEVHRFDNRIGSLRKTSRSNHAKHHNAKRQKHGFREPFDSGGLYRPQQPGKVISRPDLKSTYALPTPTPKGFSFKQRLAECEAQLAGRFGTLFTELGHLDSGKPIPKIATRAAWRSKETRKVGLRMPRLGCTPSEGAVVLAAIKHTGADDVRQAVAAELQAPAEFIKNIWERPSVWVAMDRWRRHQRLPEVGRKRVRD